MHKWQRSHDATSQEDFGLPFLCIQGGQLVAHVQNSWKLIYVPTLQHCDCVSFCNDCESITRRWLYSIDRCLAVQAYTAHTKISKCFSSHLRWAASTVPCTGVGPAISSNVVAILLVMKETIRNNGLALDKNCVAAGVTTYIDSPYSTAHFQRDFNLARLNIWRTAPYITAGL